MYITNFEEVVDALRPKLRDYLTLKLGIRSNARMFPCYIHKEENPSMNFNSKTNDETVHCYGCNSNHDIFAAASYLENLPASGSGWLEETVPSLAKLFDIPIILGDLSPLEKERAKYFKLARDIMDIGLSNNISTKGIEYATKRNWLQESLPLFSIDEDTLSSKLIGNGWKIEELNRSLMIKTKYFSFFGEDKVTFPICDSRGRPIGFISRNINSEPKYINSPESPIFEKGKHLLGLNTAITSAKNNGLFIVEGPGDLSQLRRLGVTNSAAVSSTALTEHHILLIKSLGIKCIYLSFDWDTPGLLATQRILENGLKISGLTTYVILSPQESSPDLKNSPKDPDEFLYDKKDPEIYLGLKKESAFEWQLSRASEHDSPDMLCQRMVPAIATEETAAKRELLINILSDKTNISRQAILSDVLAIRDNKYRERIEKLQLAAQRYTANVIDNPDDIMTHIASHEQDIEKIENTYNRDSIGVNYQINRFEAIHETRIKAGEEKNDTSTFQMKYFPEFQAAYSEGMAWARGSLIYAGGRQNCFPIDTLFDNPITGKKTEAQKLDHVYSINKNSSCIKKVSAYIPSGRQECFKVTNSLGFEVEVTAKHKFLTKLGWVKLKNLSVGNIIGAPIIQASFPSTKPISTDLSMFVGLMLGDGSFTQPRPIFTNNEEAIHKLLQSLVAKLFNNIQCITYYDTCNKRKGYKSVGITQKDWKTNRTKKGYCKPNPVIEFLKSLNLYGKSGKDKFIPPNLIQSKEEAIYLLSGLFLTDGSLYSSKGRPEIEFSSTSERLAREVHYLLSKLGILSTLRKRLSTSSSRRSNWKDAFIVSVRSKKMIKRFIETIPLVGRRKEVADSFNLLYNKSTGTRDYLEDINWVRIRSIESTGTKETCDIEVEDTHNFCLPGFILHNSGKTAVCILIGCDIALHDENALVIYHSTDDSYEQIEPRIKTNIWKMVNDKNLKLTVGQFVQPHLYLKPKPKEYHEAFEQTVDIFRELLSEERLVILDAEDGSTLTTLERNLRYYRNKYPNKKILTIVDNSHNLQDFPNLESTPRMTLISTRQKNIAIKYHTCMLATAEYRKNMPMDYARLRFPVDDDLADARAMMYRPNAIFHVYNDLNDRKEFADIYWKDDNDIPHPRLLLHFTKNKISGFKDKIVLDLEEKSVTLQPRNSREASIEAAQNLENRVHPRELMDKRFVTLEATEFEDN